MIGVQECFGVEDRLNSQSPPLNLMRTSSGMEDIVFKVRSTLQTFKLVSRHGRHKKYFSVRVLSASHAQRVGSVPDPSSVLISPTVQSSQQSTSSVFKFLESNFAVNVVSIQIIFSHYLVKVFTKQFRKLKCKRVYCSNFFRKHRICLYVIVPTNFGFYNFIFKSLI